MTDQGRKRESVIPCLTIQHYRNYISVGVRAINYVVALKIGPRKPSSNAFESYVVFIPMLQTFVAPIQISARTVCIYSCYLESINLSTVSGSAMQSIVSIC